MAGTPQFVDISQFQPADINWSAYKTWAQQWDGVSRVSLRSSEGTTVTDAHFARYRAGALAAGIDILILYHFADPDLNSPEAEADWQRKVVGSIRPQDVLMLDYEKQVPQANAAWALAWLERQAANYDGKLPTLYASDAYVRSRLQDSRLAHYPLTLANWQFTPTERPPCPPPWPAYTYLQYTDRATNIPGIAGKVDVNLYFGQEEPMALTIDQAANYFTASSDGSVWTCKKNNCVLGHAILAYYQQIGGGSRAPLFGLNVLGLPLTNEQGPVNNHSGTTLQIFERGILCYDPSHAIDNPPQSGDVYQMHVDSGAGLTSLLSYLKISPTESSDLTQIRADMAKLAADLGL